MFIFVKKLIPFYCDIKFKYLMQFHLQLPIKLYNCVYMFWVTRKTFDISIVLCFILHNKNDFYSLKVLTLKGSVYYHS